MKKEIYIYKVNVIPAVKFFLVEAKDKKEALEKVYDEYDEYCSQNKFLEFVPEKISKEQVAKLLNK